MSNKVHHDMGEIVHEVEEVIHDVYEGLSEEELISHSHHKKLEHWVLAIRNVAVGIAVVMFILSLTHIHYGNILKAVAYFLGATAYFAEIVLLTDCFTEKIPHQEMFMAYCFGPMYILLGLSYLLGH
jgi:hypothetical protein